MQWIKRMAHLTWNLKPNSLCELLLLNSPLLNCPPDYVLQNSPMFMNYYSHSLPSHWLYSTPDLCSSFTPSLCTSELLLLCPCCPDLYRFQFHCWAQSVVMWLMHFWISSSSLNYYYRPLLWHYFWISTTPEFVLSIVFFFLLQS